MAILQTFSKWQSIASGETANGRSNTLAYLSRRPGTRPWLVIRDATELGAWTLTLQYRYENAARWVTPRFPAATGTGTPVVASTVLGHSNGVYMLPDRLAPGEYSCLISTVSGGTVLDAWLVY